MLELIGETFSYLERWQREEFKTKTSLGFSVTVHYQWDLRKDSDVFLYPDALMAKDGIVELKVAIDLSGDVILSVLNADEWSTPESGEHQFPIPLVIGYASGLNENLQRSFMKNAVQHFEVRRVSAQRLKRLSQKIDQEQQVDINYQYIKKYPHIFSQLSEEGFVQDGYLELRDKRSGDHYRKLYHRAFRRDHSRKKPAENRRDYSDDGDCRSARHDNHSRAAGGTGDFHFYLYDYDRHDADKHLYIGDGKAGTPRGKRKRTARHASASSRFHRVAACGNE